MHFDIRDYLTPKRLTIAMWDFSWLKCHYPGGSFEDFDRVTDELLARGFNTVRIDAFPWIVGQLARPDEIVTVPGEPFANWGMSDRDREHAILDELVEFMTITRRKGIYVILSSWGTVFPPYPDRVPDLFVPVWEKTLAYLEERDLLGHVLYVDLDQEFPYFTAFNDRLNELAYRKPEENPDAPAAEATEDAADPVKPVVKATPKPACGLVWNDDQLDFVRQIFTKSLAHLQRRFPDQRFTVSLTGFWKECRLLDLKAFDVLELHFWCHGPKFDNRTAFNEMQKDREQKDYADYQRRVDATFKSVRPMLLAEMHQRLAYARDWATELGTPLTTTETWGPWWHLDHPHLRWDWLREWCVECNALAGEYGLWGSTPWNYCHPYFENWKDIAWYQEVNNAFLASGSPAGVIAG